MYEHRKTFHWHKTPRFRQRDLLPRSIELEYGGHVDYGFSEAMLALVRAEPWVSVQRLIDEDALMEIQERATQVLRAHNLPADEWGSTPVDKHSAWYYDNDCQGR